MNHDDRSPISLGAFSHHVPDSTPEEVARQLEAWGFNAVQLYFQFRDLRIPRERVDRDVALRLGRAFANLKIVCIDGFINPVHPDSAYRQRELASLEPVFQWARTMGTDTIGMMTGSYNSADPWGDHPFNHTRKALQELIDVMKDIVAEAERHNVRLCLEPCFLSVADTPQRTHQLLEAVGSDRLGVMFDPAALVGPRDEHRSGELIAEAYRLMGEQIWISHFEDILFTPQGLRYVPMGEGVIDFDAYFRVLRDANFRGDLIIEAAGRTLEAQRARIQEELGASRR